MNKTSVEIVDLFCGVGGLTCGLKKEGFKVVAGVDLDTTCKYAYEYNNKAKFINKNIKDVDGSFISSLYHNDKIKVLVGCAPCQPFSQMTTKLGSLNEADEKYDLLLEFGRIIREVKPSIISMENVPNIRNTRVFSDFLKVLNENGYYTDGGNVVYCPQYGIPQNRRRFVLLASRLGPIHLIPSTHEGHVPTVRRFIGNLPPIEAGETLETDLMHRSAKLSDLNLERIRQSSPGGTWKDWPAWMRCNCHTKESGKTYTSVYGRMKWDDIGPTITTQFYCYGTGRYGHPEQDRALSLREGALLQTFPRNYVFIEPNKKIIMKDIARQIGNAVPVRLGEVIGESITIHLQEIGA